MRIIVRSLSDHTPDVTRGRGYLCVNYLSRAITTLVPKWACPLVIIYSDQLPVSAVVNSTGLLRPGAVEYALYCGVGSVRHCL